MAAQKARTLVHEWAKSHEEHLAHEERVLMPHTQKVPGAVGPHTVRLILFTDFAAFKANMLPYAIKQLAKTKPYPGLEVYVRAVQVSRSVRDRRKTKGFFMVTAVFETASSHPFLRVGPSLP